MHFPADIVNIWRDHSIINANVWHALNLGQLLPRSKEKDIKNLKWVRTTVPPTSTLFQPGNFSQIILLAANSILFSEASLIPPWDPL